MTLVCSRGHRFDTTDIGQRVSFGDNHLVVGARCPMVMSYDRMTGTEYCRMVLHEHCAGNDKSTKCVP
jgi:hypothetical protein